MAWKDMKADVKQLLSQRFEHDQFYEILDLLTASEIEEIVLAAGSDDEAEREAAHGVLVVLEGRRDKRLLGSASSVWQDFDRARRGERWGRGPEMLTADVVFNDVIPLDAEMRLPLSDGSSLSLGPGHVWGEVRIQVRTNPDVRDSSDFISLDLRMPDVDGRVFRLAREYRADRLLFPNMNTGQVGGYGGDPEPLVRGVRCHVDHRARYPALGHVPSLVGGYPCVYWAKYLYLTVDLFRRSRPRDSRFRSADYLLVKVEPSTIGGFTQSATPVVWFGMPWLARLVVCPGLLMHSSPEPAVPLSATDEHEAPQDTVRVVVSTR